MDKRFFIIKPGVTVVSVVLGIRSGGRGAGSIGTNLYFCGWASATERVPRWRSSNISAKSFLSREAAQSFIDAKLQASAAALRVVALERG